MDEDDLSNSILEAMQTRDHQGRSCTTIRNCGDMCCLRSHPDQFKIYQIQAGKHGRGAEEQNMLLPLKDDDSSRKSYDKTPKPRQSKVDDEIFEENRENNKSLHSINSAPKQSEKSSKYQVDSRHSLNFERVDDDAEDEIFRA